MRTLKVAIVALLASGVLTGAAHAQAGRQQPQSNKPTLTMCTGSKSGNYFFAGEQIAGRLTRPFDVTVDITEAALDNLRRLMRNECDIGFTQSDVLDRFPNENPASLQEIVTVDSPYEEFVHLLCPREKSLNTVEKVADAGARILVGKEGSGTSETWNVLRKVNKKYHDLPLGTESGNDAVRMVLNSTKESRPTCMLWVSGLNSPDIQAANNLSGQRGTDGKPALALVDFNDSDFFNSKAVKGSNGKPLYEEKKITRLDPKGNKPGFYDKLIPTGWFNDTVNVPVLRAVIVTRKSWWDRLSGDQREQINKAIDMSTATIVAHVTQPK